MWNNFIISYAVIYCNYDDQEEISSIRKYYLSFEAYSIL